MAYLETKSGRSFLTVPMSTLSTQEKIQTNEIDGKVATPFKCMTNVQEVVFAYIPRAAFLPGDLNDRVVDYHYGISPSYAPRKYQIPHGRFQLHDLSV